VTPERIVVAAAGGFLFGRWIARLILAHIRDRKERRKEIESYSAYDRRMHDVQYRDLFE